MLAGFMSTWHELQSFEKTKLRRFLLKIRLRTSLRAFFLISYWGIRIHSICLRSPRIGGAGFYKKPGKQVMKTRPIDSTSPWLLHLLLPPGSCPVFQFLPWWHWCQWLERIRQTNPFRTNLFLILMFHHSNHNPNQDSK